LQPGHQVQLCRSIRRRSHRNSIRHGMLQRSIHFTPRADIAQPQSEFEEWRSPVVSP
jgi:hypothetical protein